MLPFSSVKHSTPTSNIPWTGDLMWEQLVAPRSVVYKTESLNNKTVLVFSTSGPFIGIQCDMTYSVFSMLKVMQGQNKQFHQMLCLYGKLNNNNNVTWTVICMQGKYLLSKVSGFYTVVKHGYHSIGPCVRVPLGSMVSSSLIIYCFRAPS